MKKLKLVLILSLTITNASCHESGPQKPVEHSPFKIELKDENRWKYGLSINPIFKGNPKLYTCLQSTTKIAIAKNKEVTETDILAICTAAN